MVRMLRNLLGVEKVNKSKKEAGSLFANVDVTFNTGIVKYVGEDLAGKFSVGQKVIIGNKREEVRINADEIMVMEETNVFAVVEDESNEGNQASNT